MKIQPLVSEKSIQASTLNQYNFKVPVKAKKTQVRKQVEEEHKVKVLKVRTLKPKKGQAWKKAIVRIKQGQKIPGFGAEDEK